MKPSHAARVAKNGRLVATGETYISPRLDYLVNGKYDGVIMKVTVKRGTRDGLLRMGRRHESIGALNKLGYLSPSGPGWNRRCAQFNDENEVINIGLGQGDARDCFNNNLIEWEVVRP